MSPSHRSVREWSRKASTTRQYSKQRALLDKLVATAKNNRFKVFLDWAEAPGKNVPGIVPESSADVGKARLAQHIYASLPMSTESRNAILDRPHPGGIHMGGMEQARPEARSCAGKCQPQYHESCDISSQSQTITYRSSLKSGRKFSAARVGKLADRHGPTMLGEQP